MRRFIRNASWSCITGKVHVGLWSLKVLPAHAFIPITPGASVSQLPTSSHRHLFPPPSPPPPASAWAHPHPLCIQSCACLEMQTHRRPMIILFLQGFPSHSSHLGPPSLIWPNLSPGHTTRFLFLPSGYRSRHRGCRVSSQNTKHSRALGDLSPSHPQLTARLSGFRLLRVPSGLPSPQQLFQTFPSP